MSVLASSDNQSPLTGLHQDQIHDLKSGSTPFRRTRKSSSRGSISHVDKSGGLVSPSTASGSVVSSDATSGSNPPRQRSSSMVPLSRKPSQSQVGALTGKRLMSFATSGNLLIGSDASDQRQNTQQLPILPETRRMNMNDVLIWQKFTRRLKQRVEDRRNERRTFCWLDRPLTRDMRRNGLPNIKMEPTYRMQPDEKPDMQKCKELMEEYLENALKNVSYGDVKDINQLSRSIADDLRDEVKDKAWKIRYKCVVYVTLGQKLDQSVVVSSLCAWDPTNDSYVSCSYQNGTLFCTATIFAVYLE